MLNNSLNRLITAFAIVVLVFSSVNSISAANDTNSPGNVNNTKDEAIDEVSGPIDPSLFNVRVNPTDGSLAAVPEEGATNKSGIFGIAMSSKGFADTILLAAIKILMLVIGMLSIFYIIYSGIQFTTAGGDESKIAQAKRSLVWSMVGIAVALSAYTLIVMTSNAASYTAAGKISLLRALESYV